MASKTQYYYLKIKENFFDTEDMKLLESMDNGYLYSNILMKMYLLSLKNGGRLMYKDKIPYNSKMLSTILNHNVDILDKAIQIFRELNLIEILDSGAIFMLDIQNFIGKSSDEADRIRAYRNKIESEKQGLLQMYNKSTTDVDNIKDIDITKDIDIVNSNSIDNIYDYIEKNFGRTLSPIEYEEVGTWDDNELTRYAIKQAVLNSKYNIRYISVVLNNYKKSSITTVVQAQQEEERFKQQTSKTSGYKEKYKEPVPDWLGKEIESEPASDEQVAIFEKYLRGEVLTPSEERELDIMRSMGKK